MVPEALFFPLENDTPQSDKPNCFAVSMIPVCSLNKENTFISKDYFRTSRNYTYKFTVGTRDRVGMKLYSRA